jgi:hypothetical protein
MYINFNIKEFGEFLLPHPRMTVISEKPDETYEHSVSLDNAPEGFWKYAIRPGQTTENGAPYDEPVLNIFEGFRNLPKYEFSQRLFDAGEFPFLPFDNSKMEPWIGRVRRRENISRQISGYLSLDTELKKLRKAVKAIVTAVPDLQEIDEVKEFLAYSATIEKAITNNPKKER